MDFGDNASRRMMSGRITRAVWQKEGAHHTSKYADFDRCGFCSVMEYGECQIRRYVNPPLIRSPVSQKADLVGMFTVQDVIHLIQYYYHTSSWEGAAADVEGFRLKSIRGRSIC